MLKEAKKFNATTKIFMRYFDHNHQETKCERKYYACICKKRKGKIEKISTY